VAAGVSGRGGILIALALAAVLLGAGPTNPLADFRRQTWPAITLNVLNTAVLAY
jgi:hypothetical protein